MRTRHRHRLRAMLTALAALVGPATSPPAVSCIPVPPCPEPGDGWRTAAPAVVERDRRVLVGSSS